MLHPRRFKLVILLALLPILATVIFVRQEHLRQAAFAQLKSTQSALPAAKTSFTPSGFTLPLSKYSSAQRFVLKLAWTKPKTMPAHFAALEAGIPSINGVFTLANHFDVNGFEYFQNSDKTQYCQWSTVNLCWCIRSSLIADTLVARQGAEYYSNGRQTYPKGPAGTYGFGGLGLTGFTSHAPTVTVASTGQ